MKLVLRLVYVENSSNHTTLRIIALIVHDIKCDFHAFNRRNGTIVIIVKKKRGHLPVLPHLADRHIKLLLGQSRALLL